MRKTTSLQWVDSGDPFSSKTKPGYIRIGIWTTLNTAHWQVAVKDVCLSLN
jgi:hypothetical protein